MAAYVVECFHCSVTQTFYLSHIKHTGKTPTGSPIVINEDIKYKFRTFN